MTYVNQLITDHLDIWTAATEKKSSAGRGNGGAISLYGINRLRELILELAVRGKLVPQDDADVTADGLLDQLHFQQAQMFAKGIIKKPKPVAKIVASELPFELPRGWTWCRVSQLGHDWGQKVPESQFTYIDVGSINKELGLVSEPTVLEASEAPSRARKLVRNGTVVYSTVRPYLLNIAVITEIFEPEPIASTAFAIVHPFDGVSASYLYRYFRSPTFISYVEACQTGIAYPAINDKQFFSGLVPLPPTEEQHRIVAKVDELMTLCDALERQAEDSLKAHQTLVETCLATLTNSQSSEDLTQNWTRIEAHFDTLFTTEENLALLRNEISRMAVRGIISETRVHHQSADQDLGRAAGRKKELLANGTVKARKYPAMPKKVSDPISYPDHWRTVKMSELFAVTGGIQKTPARSPKSNAYPYLGVGNVYRNRIDLSNVKSFELQDGELERYSLKTGDILIVEGNGSLTEIGRNAIWEAQMQNCVHQNHLIRCRPYLPEVVPFVSLFLNSPDGMDEMARLAITSSGLYSLSVGKISQIEVPFPPISEQNTVTTQFQNLRSICDDLESKLMKRKAVLIALSDTLTSKIY